MIFSLFFLLPLILQQNLLCSNEPKPGSSKDNSNLESISIGKEGTETTLVFCPVCQEKFTIVELKQHLPNCNEEY